MPLVGLLLIFSSCEKEQVEFPLEFTQLEDLGGYTEIASIGLGGLGAAEITAFDPITKTLFAVNNGTTNKIDVIDISNPSSISVVKSISMQPYGGFVNCVDVKNGMLAAAIESTNKQQPGKLVVFDTKTLREIANIATGALPDMVTFSPDGNFILTANEGEPNDAYTDDPAGSVTIVNVKNGFSSTTIDFSGFASRLPELASKGLRVYGPGKNFATDIEPEYITVSQDSRTAWVSLQEANAIAQIDIRSATFYWMMPLGFKNYLGHKIDASDRDNMITFSPYPIFGMYEPDAIANMEYGGKTYLFTANEGDSREYAGFNEMKRVADLKLDPVAFPDGDIKLPTRAGRLDVTTTLGDTDGDGDYDALYSLGARSFSIWDASTGAQVWDSNEELDIRARDLGLYDDARSDDKSVEPEAITLGRIGYKTIAIVGMERADAFAIYDVTNPLSPKFEKMYKTGDAPEGILFIPASKSPIGQSLIVVSSENDGLVKIYKTTKN